MDFPDTSLRKCSRRKVIPSTGYSKEALNMDYPRDKNVGFISKPYPLEWLANLVRRCLDGTPGPAKTQG